MPARDLVLKWKGALEEWISEVEKETEGGVRGSSDDRCLQALRIYFLSGADLLGRMSQKLEEPGTSEVMKRGRRPRTAPLPNPTAEEVVAASTSPASDLRRSPPRARQK